MAPGGETVSEELGVSTIKLEFRLIDKGRFRFRHCLGGFCSAFIPTRHLQIKKHSSVVILKVWEELSLI